MKKWFAGMLAVCLGLLTIMPVCAALPAGTGVVTDPGAVSGSEFSSKSSIAGKLDKMFAGNIGLYKDRKKTKLVDAALGTRNVPNNGVYQYWGERAGTSCFAYANAFYATFYDGTYPHGSLGGNHEKVKATGTISYENFVKWGVRADAAVYIREGNHSIVVLQYDEQYITYVDGNGDAKGLIALRKEAWKRGSGTNIYNQTPSLIVQPKESYFSAGRMGKKQPVPCTKGGNAHDWDEGVVTKAPSCKEKGVRTYTCLDCEKTKEEAIAKTTEHTYGNWETSREATCSRGGKEISACTVCGETKTRSTALLAHDYGKWAVTKEAGCTEEGKKVAVCKDCGKKKTKSVKALGHDYGKAVTVEKATIYSYGIKEKTCNRCQKVTTVKTDCAFRDKALGIALSAKKGVFPKNTQIVTEEGEASAETLQDVTGKVALYTILSQVKEEPVQPEGTVTLTLEVPADFGENLALYLLGQERVLLESTLEDRVLTAETEQLGVFALCDLDVSYVPAPTQTQPPTAEPTTQPTTQPVTAVATTAATTAPAQERSAEGDQAPPIMVWCLLGAIGVVICVGLTCAVIFKKRNKEKTPTQ